MMEAGPDWVSWTDAWKHGNLPALIYKSVYDAIQLGGAFQAEARPDEWKNTALNSLYSPGSSGWHRK
jgi:hypothetical protein